jgi:hypothetical protein
MKSSYFALGVSFLVLSSAATAFSDDANGSFVIARSSPSALVIWDSAPIVAIIVKNKLSDAEANELLQRDALQILIKAEPTVSAAKNIRLRIVYSKTGDINPAYGTPTFAGVERYGEIDMDHTQLTTDEGHWREAAGGRGALPAFTQLKVSGSLPPR